MILRKGVLVVFRDKVSIGTVDMARGENLPEMSGDMAVDVCFPIDGVARLIS